MAALDQLHDSLRAIPLPAFACETGPNPIPGAPCPEIPRLFQGYLNLGGLVCGEPALDRRFKTIDFLVMVDTQDMPAGIYRKMLA